VLTVAEELLSLPYIVSSRMPLSGPIPRQRSAEQQLIGTTSGSQFAGQRTVPGHEFMYSSPCSN
jgi:hypothetical protein